MNALLIDVELSDHVYGGQPMTRFDLHMREMFTRSNLPHEDYILIYRNSLTEVFRFAIEDQELYKASMRGV